ncbi:MAG: hypothetical protein NZ473_00610 [Candidatus Kapabacteria bacterium]|nr:hypothetical protein [Candidatus Kapabacteria bacterium]MCS7169836.1 hypothetical protein [Candidatus Kapabacteria bacterium]MDW7996634.1 hypothetical protein [Bacteroidota bacterium]MDW8225048.1 hypothetical protein [Bacteroidota bacterium]
MQRRKHHSILASFLAIIPVLVWAQSPPIQWGTDPSPEARAAWERAKQRLEQWKTLRLLDEVGLDESSGNQFLLRYTAYNRRIDSTLRQLDNAAQRLSLALQSSGSPEERQRSLQELLRHQHELLRLLQQRTEALRPLLSEEQFARYVLFEYRFPREIERAFLHHWRKAKHKKP